MTTRLPVIDPLGILTDMSKGKEVELYDPIREEVIGEGGPGTGEETPEEAWSAWQKYFREILYRPALSTHDDYYSQSILAGISPKHAEALIRRFQAKDPGSFGIDLAADFRDMYERTKHERV
jgi:hypothetical protein